MRRLKTTFFFMVTVSFNNYAEIISENNPDFISSSDPVVSFTGIKSIVGSLTINGGSELNDDGRNHTQSYSLIIGRGFGQPEANLTITGNSSSLNLTQGGAEGELSIAGQGSAKISILDGGTLNADRISIAYGSFFPFPPPGTVTPSDGALIIIDGTESKLTSNSINFFSDAYDIAGGNAIINISNGGLFSAKDVGISGITLYDSTITFNIGSSPGTLPVAPGIISVTNGLDFQATNSYLNFNHTSDNYNFDTPLSGKLNLNNYSGTTVLDAVNSYSGVTSINGGTLAAELSGAFSPASDFVTRGSGILALKGNNQTLASLDNGGTVSLEGSSPGTVLTVSGNYIGNNGLMIFNSALGNDTSSTDRLVVSGDTSGTTRVQVNNLGGSGAPTLNGIELISVGGASNGEFAEEGRIVAGAYDYHLTRGEGSRSSNWYLTNEVDTGGGDNGGGDNGGGDNGGGDNGGGDNGGGDNGGGDNGGGENGGSDSGEKTVAYRPEGGAYAANLAAANSMFVTRLADRQGETLYMDALTGEQRLTSMWFRSSGAHARVSDSSGQLKNQQNSYVMMLGGDLATGQAKGGSSWRLGGLAGYGKSHGTTDSSLTGYNASNEVNGYTAGLYGTWYGEGTDNAGPYLDTVIQYSWFNNEVKGEDELGEKYDSKGLQASVEGGWVFNLSQGERFGWYMQPNAQLAWSGIKVNEHTESNGTKVQSNGENNLSSRAGIRLFGEGHSKIDDNKNREFRPFIEANWIHNTENAGVSMDGVALSQTGTKNIGEMRLGIEGKLTSQLNIAGTIGQQIGDNGYNNSTAALGIKYTF
jgi:autotransporter family porin